MSCFEVVGANQRAIRIVGRAHTVSTLPLLLRTCCWPWAGLTEALAAMGLENVLRVLVLHRLVAE